MLEHTFTSTIGSILTEFFGDLGPEVFGASELLQYINIKTKSASRGSKSRSAFANHYAVYVLVEDYVKKGFHEKAGYDSYDGARFSDLFTRQRELPFGSKLQNHALNHRMNEEFRKYFPTCEFVPILRNVETNRYWINENLLRITVRDKSVNIAESVLKIIEAYIAAKRSAFDGFIETCQKVQKIQGSDPETVRKFIESLLQPNVDARVFEIVSFGVLKEYFADKTVYWGWSLDAISEEKLKLYKTGRTNANDGGIDFVMRPLGRFFQVTETTDVRKYFLDIDKVQRYPITFVVKSMDSTEEILGAIESQARRAYGVAAIVSRYMECVEEVINIPSLLSRFADLVTKGRVKPVLDEIVIQSKVEFNYEET